MNKIFVTGRITKDIELKETIGKVHYCRFNIASKSKQKDGNGEYETNFFMCVAWRAKAETIAEFCKKGSLVTVVGSMNSSEYKNESGSKETIWTVSVDDIEFNNSKEEGSKEPTLKETEDEDLPF